MGWSCSRCGETEKRHNRGEVKLEEDMGIGRGRDFSIEENLCQDCRWKFEEWLYEDEFSPLNKVTLTLEINS